MKKIICIDFDGVLHSYTSGWKGAEVILDPPVPGAIEWLTSLAEDDEFKAVIYSSRSKEPDAIWAMRIWFTDHGMSNEVLAKIDFAVEKPPAFLTIDDRAICFEGIFPDKAVMKNFKPWNKRG